MVAGEVGRPRIAVETRQLIREMARVNFLWGVPRIHGELLKLGITVSQATVSRYMPRSPKDRRSQAWRTFVRNHAIAIVQSRSFDGHNWARDLLSQVRSRSRVFTCRLSAFVVALVTDPSCWAAWYTVNPFLVAVALAPKSKVVAQRSSPATRKVDLLTIDRIRDPPTPHELKHHADCSSMRTTGKRLSSTRSSRSHGTASSSNCAQLPKYHPHPIATLGQPRIRRFVFDADMYAADILRNDSSRAASSSATA